MTIFKCLIVYHGGKVEPLETGLGKCWLCLDSWLGLSGRGETIMIFASDGCVKVGNPGIDITAVIEDAILNAEDGVGLDALRRV